jgi:hypothetical protein
MEEQKRDYQKEYHNQKAYVLSLNCEILGVWRNLKKLCTEVKESDSEFLSYWTLARKKDESPIKFTTIKGEYSLSIEKMK